MQIGCSLNREEWTVVVQERKDHGCISQELSLLVRIHGMPALGGIAWRIRYSGDILQRLPQGTHSISSMGSRELQKVSQKSFPIVVKVPQSFSRLLEC
jgi:hypothetical protein